MREEELDQRELLLKKKEMALDTREVRYYPRYYDVTNPATVTSLTRYCDVTTPATMTSLTRYYDVTNPATVTSLTRYCDVTNPLL